MKSIGHHDDDDDDDVRESKIVIKIELHLEESGR